MTDTTTVATLPAKPGVFSRIDTQAFLAIAVVLIIAAVLAVLLLKDYANLNEKVYGALLTLLGVVAACFKDVFSYYFPGSKDLSGNNDAIKAIAAQATVNPPPNGTPPAGGQPWWGKLTDAEKTALTNAAAMDPKVATFVAAASSGTAKADELADVVGKGLLTPDRAAAISGA